MRFLTPSEALTDVRVLPGLAAADIVTETDQAVEKMVLTTIKDKYPNYKYVCDLTILPYFPSSFQKSRVFLSRLASWKNFIPWQITVSSRDGGLSPRSRFLGEETYKPGMQLTVEPTFICDPIDG